jgi:quercetin dioxygenase-like cupin family protein
MGSKSQSSRPHLTRGRVCRHSPGLGAHARFRVYGRRLIEWLAMLKHIRWTDVEQEKLNPLLDRQMITGEQLMLARVLLKKGCVVPEHSHVNEQLTYIVEGALKFWIDGKEIIVRAGEVLCIPPNMPHKAEAVEDTVDVDVFYPPRQDWLSKSDAYLRNAEPARR